MMLNNTRLVGLVYFVCKGWILKLIITGLEYDFSYKKS